MNRSGLPCRANPDCEAIFVLSHQDSMDALKDAADRRNAPELEAHGYTHSPSLLPGATPFSQPAVSPRRRVRRKNEELTVV